MSSAAQKETSRHINKNHSNHSSSSQMWHTITPQHTVRILSSQRVETTICTQQSPPGTMLIYSPPNTYTHNHTRTHTHSTKVQYTDGGSLPVELAPSSLGCALVGTGPMGGLGLLGVSETVQYVMRQHRWTLSYNGGWHNGMHGAIAFTFTQPLCEVQSTRSNTSMYKS